MSSLPSRSSSAPYYGSRADPSRRPSGTGYPPSKFPYLQHMPGDQSIRSASLTSIVDMYHRRTPDDVMQPLRSPGSFYYDYTEEFDKEIPGELEYALQGASSKGRTTGIPTQDGIEPADVALPAGCKGPFSDDTYNGGLTSLPEPCCSSKILGTETAKCELATKPRAEQLKENHRMKSDLAQRRSSALSIGTSEEEWVWGGSENEKETADCETVRGVPHRLPETKTTCLERPRLQMEDDIAANPNACRAHHRRTPANTNIMVQNEDNMAESKHGGQKANVDAAIHSPNPISPAHQLRVTNSIPQLMKALPPLPDEDRHDSELPYGTSSRDVTVPAHLMYASSPTNTASPREFKAGVSIASSKPMSCGNDSAQSYHYQTQANPSRFKVRLKLSQSRLHSQWSVESSGIPERSSSNSIKPRLRLKVSRNRISNKLMGPDGTMIGNSPIRQCNSLLELKNFPQRDVSTDRSSFGEALEQQFAQLGADKRLSNIDEATTRGPSRQLSDQFDIPYPPSNKGIVTAELVTQPRFDSDLESCHRRRDFGRIIYPKPARKMSSLLQLGGIPTARQRKRKFTSNRSDRTPLQSEITQDNSFDGSLMAPSQVDVMLPRRLRNKTRRVRHWAAGSSDSEC
ncbi:hypothetical protein F53441_1409 [Fusarium austroafricanum]|uniref:Uncharacterized protein n=1 Tax=Fusarium austroafricanum TaxID=2364996 RepID=A0A8H4KVK1_9HYPO|nr:hypothetical protein F53441_1409 [Fusarium austroafricanum]